VGGATRLVLEPVGFGGGGFFLGLRAGLGGVASPPFPVWLSSYPCCFLCPCQLYLSVLLVLFVFSFRVVVGALPTLFVGFKVHP